MASKSDKELIYMPNGGGAPVEGTEELLPALDDMTPREIVRSSINISSAECGEARGGCGAAESRAAAELPPEIAKIVLPRIS